MSIKTFDPPRKPSYEVLETGSLPVSTTNSIKGWEQRRPLHISERRTYNLSWIALKQDDLDWILSFFNSLKDDDGDYGIGQPFYWTPIRSVPTPSGDSPKLEQVSGGTNSQRTYYVKYTWYNNTSTQETKESDTASLLISANYLCKITVPIFPAGADRVRIYASETEGAEKLEQTTADRTWTEPVGGLVGTGGTAPSTNNLKPAIKWVQVGTVPRPQPVAGAWRLGPITIEEQWI